MSGNITFGELLRRVEALEAKAVNLDNRLADKEAEASVYGDRIADLEAAIHRPTPVDFAMTGCLLDIDDARYQPTFVECGVCRSKPGTPLLCESCVKNRDTIYRLRRALETANGLARQWKLNYDAVKEQRDKVPHPAYAVAADWKRKYDAVAADLREKTQLLEKALADYTAQYKRADANQAAADTLERLKRGDAVDIERGGKLSQLIARNEGHYAALRTERDALAEKVAELERRLAERDKCWVPAEDLADLRRNDKRWRKLAEGWCPSVAVAIAGGGTLEEAVDAAIAAEAAEKEAKHDD